jgi:hypothetical protein
VKRAFVGGVFALMLGGCATQAPAPGQEAAEDTGLDRMERLTLLANRCWIRSNDPVFSRYSLAPELSSFSGRPRFLLVPKGRVEDRPLLVVEGQSGSREVSTYGPLLGEAAGSRILADIDRWAGGGSSCTA